LITPSANSFFNSLQIRQELLFGQGFRQSIEPEVKELCKPNDPPKEVFSAFDINTLDYGPVVALDTVDYGPGVVLDSSVGVCVDSAFSEDPDFNHPKEMYMPNDYLLNRFLEPPALEVVENFEFTKFPQDYLDIDDQVLDEELFVNFE
jgi:hypothetical protein